MELIHQLEIAAVRHLEDGVHDVPPSNLGNLLQNPLLDADCRRVEKVFPIVFVLRVAVVRDLWFEGAVVGAGAFSGCSRRHEHVSLLDVDGRLVVIERVADVDSQSLHSISGVFVQLSLEDALDLCEEHIHIVVCVAANLVLVEADLRHLRQGPVSYMCAETEERAAVHGEI